MGKKVNRYKLEVFNKEDFGLKGFNVTKISDCFQSGYVQTQDTLSNILANNNYPVTNPAWRLTETQYLILSNRIKQLTGME